MLFQPARLPLSNHAGVLSPRQTTAAGRRPPWSRRHRPPPRAPRPPTGLRRSPLSPPPRALAGKRRRHRLLCFGRPGTRSQESKCSRGLIAKVLFLLSFKSSKFVKSIENHRKIRKIQTKICWIPCSNIYNFPYRLIFSF